MKSSGATISITGKNADVSALVNQTGVSIATNSFVIGNGTGNAGVIVESGARISVTNGGTNSVGVQVENATAGANDLGAFTIAAKGNGIAAGITTSSLQPILLADQGGTLILEPSNGGGADAARHPDARFLGIDFSTVQVSAARRSGKSRHWG